MTPGLFFRLYRKNNGSDPAVLQPPLDCICGLVVQYLLERVFMAEDDLPGEERGIRELLCDVFTQGHGQVNDIGANIDPVICGKAHIPGKINVFNE